MSKLTENTNTAPPSLDDTPARGIYEAWRSAAGALLDASAQIEDARLYDALAISLGFPAREARAGFEAMGLGGEAESYIEALLHWWCRNHKRHYTRASVKEYWRIWGVEIADNNITETLRVIDVEGQHYYYKRVEIQLTAPVHLTSIYGSDSDDWGWFFATFLLVSLIPVSKRWYFNVKPYPISDTVMFAPNALDALGGTITRGGVSNQSATFSDNCMSALGGYTTRGGVSNQSATFSDNCSSALGGFMDL